MAYVFRIREWPLSSLARSAGLLLCHYKNRALVLTYQWRGGGWVIRTSDHTPELYFLPLGTNIVQFFENLHNF